MLTNDNGSITLYFGPKASLGQEANWIQTVSGKGWFIILRLYGPTEAWFDGSWRPGKIVKERWGEWCRPDQEGQGMTPRVRRFYVADGDQTTKSTLLFVGNLLTRQAEARVAEWREKGELPFPVFSESFRQQEENTLPCPPAGSSDARNG